MEVRLLGHAALWIEHGPVRLLFDPWLEGTCYDGAWGLAPERPGLIASLPRPTHVGFSHAHADHFHVPSLERLRERWGRDVPCLVPRQMVDVMTPVLRRLGFDHVHDVPLERPHRLGPDATISFHACRADDSAQIVRMGRHTLVNANDCKLEGGLLRHLCRLAPSPLFFFGQFSFADAYPFCFEGLSPDELRAAAREALDQFVTQARAFGATWSVPTASFVRFVHAENAWLNEFTNTPCAVAGAFEGQGLSVWYPGDGWSEERGFVCDPEHRRAYEMLGERPPETSVERPLVSVLELHAAAERRFDHMFAVLPRAVRSRMDPIGFRLPDAGVSLEVDWRQRRLAWLDRPPAVPYYELCASHFARVCHADWGWSTMHIACRFVARNWRVSDALSTFMPVSTLYALGYFSQPARHYLRRRTLGVAWARRREIADLARRALTGRAWSDAPVQRL